MMEMIITYQKLLVVLVIEKFGLGVLGLKSYMKFYGVSNCMFHAYDGSSSK